MDNELTRMERIGGSASHEEDDKSGKVFKPSPVTCCKSMSKKRLLVILLICTITVSVVTVAIVVPIVLTKKHQQDEMKNRTTNFNGDDTNNSIVANVSGELYCPNPWIKVDTTCFYVSDERANYSQSKEKCISLGGIIASFTQDEFEVITLKFIQADDYWIGLTCLLNCTNILNWNWEDGTKTDSWVESNWAVGEPGTGEAHVRLTAMNEFAGVGPTLNIRYICKSDTLLINISCPNPGGSFNLTIGSYQLSPQRVEYKCNIGYTLAGSPVQTCSETGSWDPEQRPKCIGKSSDACSSLDNELLPIINVSRISVNAQVGLTTDVTYRSLWPTSTYLVAGHHNTPTISFLYSNGTEENVCDIAIEEETIWSGVEIGDNIHAVIGYSFSRIGRTSLYIITFGEGKTAIANPIITRNPARVVIVDNCTFGVLCHNDDRLTARIEIYNRTAPHTNIETITIELPNDEISYRRVDNICWGTERDFYISAYWTRKIYHYSFNGTLLDYWSPYPIFDLPQSLPVNIFVDLSGSVIVISSDANVLTYTNGTWSQFELSEIDRFIQLALYRNMLYVSGADRLVIFDI